jgi:YidC/Oxa1 family membrane protein insertase
MFVVANVLQPLIDVNDAIVKFWHDTMGLGWGLSIIGLTVVVRLAILPLTFKQVRSMQGLQKLQPEMKKIQERYKDDKKRQQEEVWKLYQEHQVNPFGSCLPLILQIPFFFALYQTLRKGGEIFNQIRAEPSNDDGFLFIPNLTKDVTHHTGVLIALLLLYVSTQLVSSWVSAINIQDKTQRRLLFIFPIFFSVIIIRFPAGLIVYWITTNLWTIGQQLFIRRFMPPPEPSAVKAGAGAAGGGGGGWFARAMAGAAGDGAGSRNARASGGARERSRGGGARSKPSASSGGSKSSGSPGRAKPSASSGRSGDGKGRSGSGGDGNGGPRKAPPPSPRKKKKRSGRRR